VTDHRLVTIMFNKSDLWSHVSSLGQFPAVYVYILSNMKERTKQENKKEGKGKKETEKLEAERGR